MNNPVRMGILLFSMIVVHGQTTVDPNVESTMSPAPVTTHSPVVAENDDNVVVVATDVPAAATRAVVAEDNDDDIVLATNVPVAATRVDHPVHAKGLGTEIDAPDLDLAQDHLGIHGEYENGLLDDDYDPWAAWKDDDLHGELDKHDPFYEDFKNDLGRRGNVPEENLDFDSEDHRLDEFDFSPSEGLQFVLKPHAKECFYEHALTSEDHLRGAFMTVAGDPKIDVVITDPNGATIFNEIGKTESEYDVDIKNLGVHEICFDNSRYSTEKMLIFATETLESQHPVQKQHLSHLSQSASHLDLKLGKLESEQRLYHLRADRHIQTEESTSLRLSWYTSLECFSYCAISIVQVTYIKHILEQPLISRSWA